MAAHDSDEAIQISGTTSQQIQGILDALEELYPEGAVEVGHDRKPSPQRAEFKLYTCHNDPPLIPVSRPFRTEFSDDEELPPFFKAVHREDGEGFVLEPHQPSEALSASVKEMISKAKVEVESRGGEMSVSGSFPNLFEMAVSSLTSSSSEEEEGIEEVSRDIVGSVVLRAIEESESKIRDFSKTRRPRSPQTRYSMTGIPPECPFGPDD